MNKNQLLALAAFITSLANDGECSTTTETVPAGDPPAPKKPRGRPPGTLGTANAIEHLKNIAAETEKEKPAEPDPAPTGSKTYEDMKALIEPLVKGYWNGKKDEKEWQPRGGEVRPVIAKYAPTLIQMDPKDYPAFEKDIEALLY